MPPAQVLQQFSSSTVMSAPETAMTKATCP